MEWNGTMSSSSSCRPSGKRTSATSPSLFLLNPFCKQKNPQKQQHIHAHLRCFFLSFSPSCFRFFFLFPFLLSFHWLYVVHLSHPASFSFLCDSTRLVSPLLLAWYRFLHIGRLYVANGTTPVRSLKAPPLSVVCVCSDEIN